MGTLLFVSEYEIVAFGYSDWVRNRGFQFNKDRFTNGYSIDERTHTVEIRSDDNFELALNRSLCPRIGSEGGAVHAVGESFDIGTRLVDVRQQYASVTPHRQLRAIR